MTPMPNNFTCWNMVLAKCNTWWSHVYICGLQRRTVTESVQVTIRQGMDDLAPAATAPIKETGRQPGDASPKTALGRYGVRKKRISSLCILASSKGAYITDPLNCFVPARISSAGHQMIHAVRYEHNLTIQSGPVIKTSVYATPRL